MQVRKVWLRMTIEHFRGYVVGTAGDNEIAAAVVARGRMGPSQRRLSLYIRAGFLFV